MVNCSSETNEDWNPEDCGIIALNYGKKKENLLIQNPIASKIILQKWEWKTFSGNWKVRVFLSTESHHTEC